MKYQLRIVRFLALTLFGSILLTACGDSALTPETTVPADSGSTAPAAETSAVCNLPDTDWGGREFRVLAEESTTYPQFSNFEIYAESENGDLVNDAVYRRNTTIEDKYNVKITQHLVTNATFPNSVEELNKAVLSGDDLYDLAFCELRYIGVPAQDGYFYDLNQVEYIDFEKSWWNADVNEHLEINENLYFTTSDFSLRDKNRVYIMIYNRDMAEEYQLGDAVQLVRDGKWTIGEMQEWTKAVSHDVDSDGAMSLDDTYGIGFDSPYGFSALLYGMDNRILRTNAVGKPELSLNNEHMINSIDRAFAVANPPTGVYCNDFFGKLEYDFNQVVGNLFNNGQILFATSFPHSLASKSANCVFDYGVLPFPKYDEAQKSYLTMSDVYSMLFGIPITTPDPDFAGFMLEALSYGSKDVLYNYYEITCKIKHTYDEASAEMLDIIFDGIVYDIGLIYDIGMKPLIGSTLANAKENIFASEYAKLEPKAQTMLDKIFDSNNN